MSDARLRRLARVWKESGTVEDEARYLQEALRTARVSRKRLELAAYLQHPAAVEVVGVRPPRKRVFHRVLWEQPKGMFVGTNVSEWISFELLGSVDDLRRWGISLEQFDEEARLRAGLGDARRCLVDLKKALAPHSTERWAEPMRLGERWAARLLEEVQTKLLDPASAQHGSERPNLTALVRDDETYDHPDLEYLAHQAVQSAQALVDHLSGAEELVVGSWWTREIPIHVLGSIQDEVIPWALGYADPIRRRQERSLDTIEVASPCPMEWSAMRGDERTRFCDRCNLNVHDLSSLTRVEAEALLRGSGGEVCVRLYRRTDGTVLTRDCTVGLTRRTERLQDERLRSRQHMMGVVNW